MRFMGEKADLLAADWVLPIEDQQPAVRRRRHWEMLGLATVAVVMAYLLIILPDQRVAFFFLPSLPLPETCLPRQWWGVTCPGCGLTRSIILLAHGDLAGSLARHHLGWLMAVAILGQFPYRYYALRHREPGYAVQRVCTAFGYLLIALLIGNWVVGLLLGPRV